jgi:hypothetical protein
VESITLPPNGVATRIPEKFSAIQHSAELVALPCFERPPATHRLGAAEWNHHRFSSFNTERIRIYNNPPGTRPWVYALLARIPETEFKRSQTDVAFSED